LRRKKVADQEIKMDAGNKFLMVVSVLVLAAVVAFLVYQLAGFLGQLALGERDPAPAVIETVEQRIAPVGRVEVAAVDPNAAPAAPKPASEVYASVCSACHNAGVAGAPRADDGDEWARRLDEKGLDTLVSHSINGFQAMPARGGNPNLSDEEVAGTVAYILEQAGVRVADDAAVAAEAPAVEEAAESAVEEAAEPAVAGDAAAGKDRFATCASCHGAQGQGMGIFPKIAGQSPDYVAGRLQQYRAGEQVGPTSALMMPHASGLSDEAIADLAAYIASLP
jgi:cytochrome c5